MSLKKPTLWFAAALIAAATAPAFAIDSGDSNDASGGPAPLDCKEGMVYDEQSKICVPVESGLTGSEADLFEQGREEALAGDYDAALATFARIETREDARLLTMIGYATRKSGAVEEGIEFYQQALAIEPDRLDTLEYLGEGYVAAGDVNKAVDLLNRLEELCGTDCEQHKLLAAAIAGETVWK